MEGYGSVLGTALTFLALCVTRRAAGQRASWLSEKDVEFFTGSGVGEASSSEPEDPEAKATVQVGAGSRGVGYAD